MLMLILDTGMITRVEISMKEVISDLIQKRYPKKRTRRRAGGGQKADRLDKNIIQDLQRGAADDLKFETEL